MWGHLEQKSIGHDAYHGPALDGSNLWPSPSISVATLLRASGHVSLHENVKSRRTESSEQSDWHRWPYGA